jgi:2-amino-4-hydroxy-6-hydroxymethyldihydropteridine diphosphokinase
MTQAFIGLGSNIGDRLQNLCLAVREMIKHNAGALVNLSAVYQTEPVGFQEQADFFNAVAEIKTALGPQQLLARLQEIELALGRKRKVHWGPRSIDLDLLGYNHLLLQHDPILLLPHPQLANRRFVLQPFCDIAPDWLVPGIDKTIKQLLSVCADSHQVQLNTTASAFKKLLIEG